MFSAFVVARVKPFVCMCVLFDCVRVLMDMVLELSGNYIITLVDRQTLTSYCICNIYIIPVVVKQLVVGMVCCCSSRCARTSGS